jgi:peptidoglycan/LPS O-acetylase OafA/YrhL
MIRRSNLLALTVPTLDLLIRSGSMLISAPATGVVWEPIGTLAPLLIFDFLVGIAASLLVLKSKRIRMRSVWRPLFPSLAAALVLWKLWFGPLISPMVVWYGLMSFAVFLTVIFIFVAAWRASENEGESHI